MSGRSKQINVALSEDEMEALKDNAAWFAMSLSEYVRYVALGNTLDRGVSTERWRAHLRRKAAA